jgi:hypothetical protein
MVGTLEEAMRGETRNTALCIVSDHGFASIDHQLNISALFVKAGLIGKDWTAAPWGTGGLVFVVLKDPRDTQVRGAVEKLLQQMAADPANGINHILDRTEAVDMKPGFSIGGAPDGPAVREIKPGGTHGYSPVHPEMLASFLIAGPGVDSGGLFGRVSYDRRFACAEYRCRGETLAQEAFSAGPLPSLREML